jgi:hypothetical protein
LALLSPCNVQCGSIDLRDILPERIVDRPDCIDRFDHTNPSVFCTLAAGEIYKIDGDAWITEGITSTARMMQLNLQQVFDFRANLR